MVKCKTMPTTNTTMKKHWKAVKSMGLVVLLSIGFWAPFSIFGITMEKIYQAPNIDFKTSYFPENGIIFLFVFGLSMRIPASIQFFIFGVTVKFGEV